MEEIGTKDQKEMEMKSDREQKVTYLLIAGICLIGFLLCIRVHFGLDLSDETHYLALAKRFAQGDRPFREEWFPAQIIGILLLPFYRLYNKLNGGIDGILLSARLWFVFFHTIVSLVVFQVLMQRERVERIPAFFFSLFFLFYARANIHSFSYYNVGLITFLLYLIVRRGEQRLAQTGSGILFAISVLCMPYLVLYFLGMEICSVIRIMKGERRWTEELLFLAGIGICAGIFLGYILSSGNAGEILRNLPEILTDPEHQGTMVGSVFSFACFMIQVFYKYLFWPMVLEFAGILYYIRKGRKEERLKTVLKVMAYALFFLQAVYLRTFFEGGIIIAFFLLAVQVAGLEQIYGRRLWDSYALPGLLYGLIWMMGSNVGQRVFNMGCLISCIWAVEVVWKDSRSEHRKWAGTLKTCSILWTLLMLAGISFFDIYRDSSIEKLTVKLETGAARGIYTSSKRAEEYEKVLNDLSKYAGWEKTLAVGGVEPWVYLEAKARCGVQAVWRLDFSDDRNDKYYERYPNKTPDVIFLLSPSYKTYEGWRYSSHGSNREGVGERVLEGYLLELVEKEHYSKVETESGDFYIKE